MRRGEIFWVDFDPVRRPECSKVRPAVVISNDAANRTAQRLGRGTVTVVPVTSNVDRVFPFQVLLHSRDCGLSADSKAQAEQVRVVSISRVQGRAGAVPMEVMARIDDALRTHLAL
jgi:mRNA interferase MazF